MDRKSMEQLKLDRRLIRRRGWISAAELERELEALPDVSENIEKDEPEAPAAGAQQGAAEP